jgi:hypothetical protein
MIPNTEYTYSTGWNLQNVHRGRINNYGYDSPQDYQPGRGDIAVFGDSYIEAMMNDHGDTLPGALNDYLRSPREVLSFGMSGAEMPDYLGVSALVRKEFSPEWAVFVITAGDFTTGFNAAPGFFEWDARQSPPIRLVPEIHRSELSKFSRTVGLVRYLRGNLLLRPGEMIKLRRGADHAAGASACRDEVLSNEDEQLLQAFARDLPLALGLPPAGVSVGTQAVRRRAAVMAVSACLCIGASCRRDAGMRKPRLPGRCSGGGARSSAESGQLPQSAGVMVLRYGRGLTTPGHGRHVSR